jgi:hypothetical protein
VVTWRGPHMCRAHWMGSDTQPFFRIRTGYGQEWTISSAHADGVPGSSRGGPASGRLFPVVANGRSRPLLRGGTAGLFLPAPRTV